MKLYFAPNACSLAPHIVLREIGQAFELVRVNNKTKATSEGGNFLDVNPKGYVAALALDNGQVLTEGTAILQYLADLDPEHKLAPVNGSWERVRLQEWLNFLTSEIHAGCSPLFSGDIPDDIKAIFKQKLFKRFEYLVNTLKAQDYLLGAQFSVVDAYLFTILTWTPALGIDLKEWPVLDAFVQRIAARPSVQAARAAEAATAPVA